MKIFIFIEWALFHSQSLCYVINIYIYVCICMYVCNIMLVLGGVHVMQFSVQGRSPHGAGTDGHR